jgi:drug/metabolite transporter (DMT)-like permease
LTLTADPEAPPSPGAPTWRADTALVVSAFVFGTTFVVVKDAIDDVDPLPFLAVRFLVGAAVLGLASIGRPGSPHELRHGVVAGLALWCGYALQTFGLQHTDPATSAFLTYMLVVIVPVMGFVVLRRRLHPATLAGIAIAVVGLVLLTGGAAAGLGLGELLTIGCAFGFAAHIVVVAQTATRHDPVRFTAFQLATVAVVSLAAGSVDDPTAVAFGGAPLVAAAFTGIFATALGFLAMVWAQRTVGPSRTALVLLLEPVFAAALSWARGDPLTWATAAGGALILLGVLVAEVLPQRLTTWSR